MKLRIRWIWPMIMLMLASTATAQLPVLDSLCSGSVRHYAVNGESGSAYSWILTPPSGPEITLPSDNDSIEIAWTNPGGIYTLRVIQHGLNGCDADAVYGLVFIFDQPEVFAGNDDNVCPGNDYALLNATSAHCVHLQWVSSGDGTFDNDTVLHPVYTPGSGDIASGSVVLTLIGTGLLGDQYGCEPAYSSLRLNFVTVIVPQFEPIGPLCQFSIPPPLPDTSLQGITGTWTPPVINTDFLGTFPYTFSPDDPAQCGVDTTLMIVITDIIIPLFEPIGPLCVNSVPPSLPDTSLQGITGQWEPAVITTDVPGVFIYTFTPDDPTQCGLPVTMEVTVNPQVIPVFEQIGPVCQYAEGPQLPSSSLNNITGTWYPPVIITAWPGTFTYTFTPDPATCGIAVTMEITILPEITPVFDPIGPLCQFSTAPLLPAVSLNGVTGDWNPPGINTNIPGVFFHTFTPDTSFHCAMPVTLAIAVLEIVIPSFDPIGPLCQYSVPPALPDTSAEGLHGTWNPAIISTSNVGTFVFTFTPDPESCASPSIIEITVTDLIIPQFDPIGPLCLNSLPPVLPAVSLNGISGIWEPPAISTNDQGVFSYSFTPDSGQCSVPASLLIEVNGSILPSFGAIGPLCQNSVPPELPSVSNEGLTGTWDPAVINTAITGIFSYLFTPDEGQCGAETILEIIITEEITPMFNPIGPLCRFSIPPALPLVSVNGLTGTWLPQYINTNNPGSENYAFTPDPGQCGTTTYLTIVVTEQAIPVFDPIGPLSQNSAAPPLPDTSLNGIVGSWTPPFIDTSTPGTFLYSFIPDTGQCAANSSMEITVLFDMLQAITGPGEHCLGDAAIVPVDVDKFCGVAVFQLKLSYNADKLWCEGYMNLHPQLAENFTGIVDNYNGTITLDWHSEDPVTFSCKEKVCELVFTPKEPGEGQLLWYTGNSESYFLDLNGNQIPAEFFSEDLLIYQPPEILLADSKTVCEGQEVSILSLAISTYPPVNYVWTLPDGDTSLTDPYFSSITMDDAGDYILLATDSLGCSDQKAIRLMVSANPVADFHGTDTLYVNQGYVLDAGFGMESYTWNTGETTESISIGQEGWYWVTMVTHAGCIGIDSVYMVFTELPEECLYIPNAFTPDNDGLNDVFLATSACPLAKFEMLIYNRWGEMLFESDNISHGWDGTKNGVLCPGDAYVYKVSFRKTDHPDEKEIVKVGAVIIVR